MVFRCLFSLETLVLVFKNAPQNALGYRFEGPINRPGIVFQAQFSIKEGAIKVQISNNIPLN
jgi:propanediol dehydratase large subunit